MNKNDLIIESTINVAPLKQKESSSASTFDIDSVYGAYYWLEPSMNNKILLSQTIVDYVDNNFKTTEQLQLEEQLVRAETKHKEIMTNALSQLAEQKKQTEKTQKSLRISWAAFIVSLVGVAVAILVPRYTSTKFDKSQLDDLKHSIISLTPLQTIDAKIINDTLNVNVTNENLNKNKHEKHQAQPRRPITAQ